MYVIKVIKIQSIIQQTVSNKLKNKLKSNRLWYICFLVCFSFIFFLTLCICLPCFYFYRMILRGVARGAGCHVPRSSIELIFLLKKLALLGRKACFIQ